MQRMVEDHKELLDRRRSRIEGKLASVRRRLEILRQSAADARERLDAWVQGDGAAAGSLEEVNGLRTLFRDLNSAISEQQARLAELQARRDALQPTQLLLEPRFSEGPVAPNRRLHLALGLVLGLFLSVFAAFVVEFWANNRARILAEAGDGPGRE
jgi:uncharacterized protein involved in exopolysaccharide biosynthesis